MREEDDCAERGAGRFHVHAFGHGVAADRLFVRRGCKLDPGRRAPRRFRRLGRSQDRGFVQGLAGRLAIVALLATAGLPSAADADTWRVDPARSTFAILTQRAGFAAALAHDHLVVAREPRCEFAFDPAVPEKTTFRMTSKVRDLEVDPAAERTRLGARLKALGAAARDLPPVSDDDRASIRSNMLAEGQLDAGRFPEVRAELLSLRREDAGAQGAAEGFDWTASVRIELHGRSAEVTAPVRAEISGDEASAEMVATLRFTDFGIEPYSAALGAVRNDDVFRVYADVVATREDPR